MTRSLRSNIFGIGGRLALMGAIWALPSLGVAEMGHQHQPDATGQCAALPAELQAIVSAMDVPGQKVEALIQRGDMTPLTPDVRRLDVILHPADQVSLAAMAGRKGQGRSGDWSETFAGLLELTVPSDGVYRISSSSRTWIDILEREQAVARARPTHRLHRCGHVHKSVEFPLKKGSAYWLEVSGSESPVISLIITPEMD
ncbi:MAG: hypothetical protein OJF47_001317 [Nitrospira sp.]|nr:MAG: hypothetical protein OJF47_001317 [Nitrospira sp.]